MPRSLTRIGTYSDLPFKLSLGSTGDIEPTSTGVAIRQSLFNIMNTSPGQRPLNPTFGANLARFLFDPFDEETGNKIGETLRRAFSEWETRITLRKIRIELDIDNSEYIINVTYLIKETNTLDSIQVELQRL